MEITESGSESRFWASTFQWMRPQIWLDPFVHLYSMCVSLCLLAHLSFPVHSFGLHPQGQRWLGGGAGLIWAVGVLWPLQLHFESLHADLKAIHGLDSSLSAARVIKAHKAWRTKGERWRQREDNRLAPDGWEGNGMDRWTLDRRDRERIRLEIILWQRMRWAWNEMREGIKQVYLNHRYTYLPHV